MKQRSVPQRQTKSRVPTLRLRPTRGWSRLALHELWQYRHLIWMLVWRDTKSRYRQMALGPLWIILHPVVNMVVFSLVFGKLAQLPSDGVPYPVFTYTALLPWTYFASATTASVGSLGQYMSIITKVYFPRLVIPTAAVISSLVDFALSFTVLLGMMFFYRLALSPAVVLLPCYLLLAAATSLSLGLWGAALAVKFRDLKYVITYGLPIFMYATPVAYSARLIPEKWQALYQLNPMYWVVEGFRWLLLGKGHGPDTFMLIPVGLVMILLISGLFIFRRTERTIVDWL